MSSQIANITIEEAYNSLKTNSTTKEWKIEPTRTNNNKKKEAKITYKGKIPCISIGYFEDEKTQELFPCWDGLKYYSQADKKFKPVPANKHAVSWATESYQGKGRPYGTGIFELGMKTWDVEKSQPWYLYQFWQMFYEWVIYSLVHGVEDASSDTGRSYLTNMTGNKPMSVSDKENLYRVITASPMSEGGEYQPRFSMNLAYAIQPDDNVGQFVLPQMSIRNGTVDQNVEVPDYDKFDFIKPKCFGRYMFSIQPISFNGNKIRIKAETRLGVFYPRGNIFGDVELPKREAVELPTRDEGESAERPAKMQRTEEGEGTDT